MANVSGIRHAGHIMRSVHDLPGSRRNVLDRSSPTPSARSAADCAVHPWWQFSCGDLVAIAAAEMDRLYEQIRDWGYALRLRGGRGVTLYERVDPEVLQRGRGQEAALTCIEAEICSPRDGLVAVLEASCADIPDTCVSPMHLRVLLGLSAQVIEKGLFLRYYRRHAVVRFHRRAELVDLLHDGVLVLDAADGTVIAADRFAVELLQAVDRYAIVGRSIDEIFAAEDSGPLSLQIGSGAVRLPVCDLCHRHRYYLSMHRGKASSSHGRSGPAVGRAPTLVRVAPDPGPRPLTLEALAGEDAQMLRNVRSAHRIVDSAVPVLIQGPTGSGKEAFAHAMHLASRRADRPFVAVNCAAIPESLIESELFGYRPGAFTGARKEGMKGRIQQSSGGTLFLDEIGDMPLALQTRLLRVLEEQKFVPLGGETPIEVELHVFAASHRNLREMIARGSFREDLYYRLNGITLELPALKDRTDRERVLHQVLAAETADGRPAAIELDALERLLAYSWPGNIRELRNVIRTALAICDGGVIREVDLPHELREHARCPAGMPTGAADPLRDAERAALLRVIDACGGNMTRAASHLRMSRNTLYRRMKRHGIPLGRPSASGGVTDT